MNPASNLILVGPMGGGKTSIGQHLAARFGLRLLDADREIERESGATVVQLFEREGEAGFRQRESAALARLLREDGIVLSTGGGAVLDGGNRALLARPDREQVLRELGAVRTPLYAEVADLAFDPGDLDIDSASARLAELLAHHWQRLGAAA